MDKNIDTFVASLGGVTDSHTGGLVPAVHMGVTHVLIPGEAAIGYARGGAVEGSLFERMMVGLDGGAAALGFVSGASAAQALLATFAKGSHIVLEERGYYEFRGILMRAAEARGLAVETVDLCDTEAVAKALRPGQTALIWSELPTNPEWRMPDIRRLSELGRNAGTRLLVDATAATPYHCRPIEHGADIVLHSATKYLNGHGDLTAGALVVADPNLREKLIAIRTENGTVLSPMQEWLLLRGLRTLAVRMQRASASAMAIAEWLAAHQRVHTVHYPGLPGHPQFELASRQYGRGFGAMLSFRVSDSTCAAKITNATTVFRQSTSLGSTESLIEHRAMTEGEGTLCPDDLIRLSIGLEDPRDLIEDLRRAMS
ncbi:cystathionine gamma-synthase (plasmid) [Neorhizobium sp. NCHU2750]|nr:cystathionine gamma-synthase [Neorhizobium sp. NCHU2750]